MTSSLDLMGALLVGLAGAGHCIGMCGGVSAALSMAIPAEKQHFWGRLGYLLNYNLGRILSYVLAGALVGGLLATTTEIGAGKHALAGLRLIAALLMIALGLYLAGWWHGVLLLERIGASNLFAVVVGGDTLAERKPSGAPLLHVAERLGIAPAELLMVGDSANDALTARNAGCPVYLVPHGYADPSQFDCDRVLRNTAELRELIG